MYSYVSVDKSVVINNPAIRRYFGKEKRTNLILYKLKEA